MKANLLRVSIMVAVVFAFAAVSTYGQSVSRRETFVVPFDFNVGQKVLPAGEYTFSSEKEIVRIQSRDRKHNLITLPFRTHWGTVSQANTKLTFKRSGDSYFLSQIWLPDGIGREIKRKVPSGTEVSMNSKTVEVQSNGR
jgi:hypothetical protein